MLHPQSTPDAQQMFATSPRAARWADVPDAQWTDWRWQLQHRLNTLADLEDLLDLTDSERRGIAGGGFKLDITPYFASLMHRSDPTCPVRRQVVPTHHEHEGYVGMQADSLAEDQHSPVAGLVHRYPNKALMLVTTHCASYCRYCTRSRIVGDAAETFKPEEFAAQLDYLRRTPQIHDVLLSGGDPLTLAPKVLRGLIAALRAIEHIEVVRIGTRVPVFLPMRVTQDLCDVLGEFDVWVNIHVNHPKEITPEVAAACRRLARAGVPLGNQSVLLRGVNDHPAIFAKLVRELVKVKVRPYYIYAVDAVPGAKNFRVPVGVGLEIMEALRGRASGFAVPTFVLDAPGGGGKIPLAPTYLLAHSPDRVVARNFEGAVFAVAEPRDYAGPDMAVPAEWSARDAGQSGVAGLLRGDGERIVPAGWGAAHQRPGAAPHRLNPGPASGAAGHPDPAQDVPG